MASVANSAKVGRGKWKTLWVQKAASTAIKTGTLVQLTSGYVNPATTTAGAVSTPLLGIYNGPTITTASANYATTDKIEVLVPAEPLAEALLTVGTGSLAATDVGLSFDIDTDSEVTVSTSDYEAVTCTEYVSATQGYFVFTNLSSPIA